jgi:hypothetical protein
MSDGEYPTPPSGGGRSATSGGLPYRYLYCPCGAIADSATFRVLTYGPGLYHAADTGMDHRFEFIDDALVTYLVLVGPNVHLEPSQIVYRWVPDLQCWAITEIH